MLVVVSVKGLIIRVCGKKFFGGGRVWGVGCGVWGFTSFEVANYLIFREKVPFRFIQQALSRGTDKKLSRDCHP
ncbi:MAG: hypothetical protein EWV48_02990 [Microcystis aeruginosa Ma_QC_C_20070823_S13]|nr:MAG: hypothetical protein EWV48_02990 [Microcystis aeruginosa Ma_QC_C_20070823_S13]